jgi:hypothetical protein
MIPGGGEASSILNPFDPERIRLSTNYAAMVNGRSAGLIVSLWNKPPKTAWFRVHPTNEVDVLMLDLTERTPDELYYVDPAIRHHLLTEPTISPRLLVQVQTSTGSNAIWAVKLGGFSRNRGNAWTNTVIRAKELAKTRWIRLISDQEAKCYDPKISDEIRHEPRWPDVPFSAVLESALKDRDLATWDDPILVELRTGQARSRDLPPGDDPLPAGLPGR